MTRFTLRVPDELHDKLTALAEEDRRSMNAYVVRILARWAAAKASPIVASRVPRKPNGATTTHAVDSDDLDI